MQWISAKSVPRLLTDEQKHRHVFVYQELMDGIRNYTNFLSKS
jgi:hypothetical protein